MKNRRWAIAGAAISAIIVLSGCNGDGDAPSAAANGGPAATVTSTPADPGSEFEAAITKTVATSVKLKMTALGGIQITGAADPKAKVSDVSFDLGPAGSMATRQVGDDVYVKAGGQLSASTGVASGKWMHLDTSDIPANSPLKTQGDPQQTAKMLAASSDVTKTGEHSFSGKIDMTKSSTIDPSDLSGLTDKLKAVPFTAETDDQDRIAKLVIDVDSIAPGAGDMTVEYSDFGAPVDVKAPPSSQVVPMPAAFRKAMGG
jgi:hypothetical protein